MNSLNTSESPPADASSKRGDSKRANEKSNLELLLELDAVASTLPTMTPTCGGLLSPPTGVQPGFTDADAITPVGPCHAPTVQIEMLSRAVSGGLGAKRRWPRAPHLASSRMVALEITFTNHSDREVTNVRVGTKTVSGSRALHEFPPIALLPPGASAAATLGLDFADSIQPIHFTVLSSLGEVAVSVTPPVGELMRAVTMSEARWEAERAKLRGMTECDTKAARLADEKATCRRVYDAANVFPVTSEGDYLRFAARMMSSQELVLLSVRLEPDHSLVTANCGNMAVASLLAGEVAAALARS